MRSLPAIALMFLVTSPAYAATSGRVIAEQRANEDMGRSAHTASFALTQGIAYPVSWSDGTRWQVVLAPDGVDLAPLRDATQLDTFSADVLKRAGKPAVKFTVDSDGGVVDMYLWADGKLELGASGTMGKFYGAKLANGRLGGHYAYLGDLFGNPIVIDATVDVPVWTSPKGTPLPAGGGEPGKAYLALAAAIAEGDIDAILAARPPEQRPPPAELAEFKAMLPMIQAMSPEQPKVERGAIVAGKAILEVAGQREGEPGRWTITMVESDGRWLMEESSTGGSDASSPPPPFADAPPDLLPALPADGVAGDPAIFGGETYAVTNALAVHSGDETHMVLLAPARLDPKHVAALWSDDMPLEPLFGGKGMRSLLLVFGGISGALEPIEGFTIADDGAFSKEFMLRGTALRIGDRLYGEYLSTETNPDTGENRTLGAVRWSLPVIDARN